MLVDYYLSRASHTQLEGQSYLSPSSPSSPSSSSSFPCSECAVAKEALRVLERWTEGGKCTVREQKMQLAPATYIICICTVCAVCVCVCVW